MPSSSYQGRQLRPARKRKESDMMNPRVIQSLTESCYRPHLPESPISPKLRRKEAPGGECCPGPHQRGTNVKHPRDQIGHLPQNEDPE